MLPEVKDRTEVDLSSPENSVEQVQQWRELESTLNERLSAVTQRIERMWGVVDGDATISLRQKAQRPTRSRKPLIQLPRICNVIMLTNGRRTPDLLVRRAPRIF